MNSVVWVESWRVSLPRGQRAIIDRAMRFDLREVRARYVKDYQSTVKDYQSTVKEAKVLERELKRYLVLRALYPHIPYGMAGPTDDFWHTFLLFTREYARFCDHIAGRFLHHIPGVNQGARQVEQFKEDYANLWRDYPLVFGEFPPSSVWPPLENITVPNRGRSRGKRRG